MIAGVDGCRGGWLVALEPAANAITMHVVRSASELFERWPALVLAVIDIPIGLTERTPREADLAARRYLGVRGCTVFPAPYRAMLEAVGMPPEHGQAEASRIRRSLDGKGCSRQAYMIFDKIAEVDRTVTPDLQARLVEGHPEVSFAAIRNGCPILTKKSRRAGRHAQVEALAPHFGDVLPLVAQARALGAAADDALDAMALLWTARRLQRGEPVLRLPSTAEPVSSGLAAQIVA